MGGGSACFGSGSSVGTQGWQRDSRSQEFVCVYVCLFMCLCVSQGWRALVGAVRNRGVCLLFLVERLDFTTI